MYPEMNMELLSNLLDSFKQPVVFADKQHVIRYLNRAAQDYYAKGAGLLGQDLMACHNKQSQQLMLDIVQRMASEGLDEQLITDNAKHRIYMRAVRSADGEFIGYYERFEPPLGK